MKTAIAKGDEQQRPSRVAVDSSCGPGELHPVYVCQERACREPISDREARVSVCVGKSPRGADPGLRALTR